MATKPATAEGSSPLGDSSHIDDSLMTEPSEQSPRVDDPHLRRQKRKRTSPEDQIILEAAYKRDPKPDKAARLELVKQVALGEKEVQIWFQNRRQSSRRKSRPLLPHEIAQYQMSRVAASSSTLTSSYDSDDFVQHQTSHSVSGAGQDARGSGSSDDAESDDSGSVNEQHQRDVNAQYQSPEAESQRNPGLGHGLVGDAAVVSASMPALVSASAQFAAPVGSLASRRNAPPTLRHSFSSPSMPPPSSLDASHRQLKRSTSFLRLSMNAEGKAEVTTKDASSPSPPRPHQAVLLPEIATKPDHIHILPPLSNTLSGRSRDSRSWEFWCDKESRNELETAAKKDASGSAAGAIGLLRTASGRNILGSLSSKRNGVFQSPHEPVKRSKHDHKRSSLQRSSTSYGRLQGQKAHSNPAAPKLKSSGSAKAVHVSGTDSDKENWSPGGDAESDSLSQGQVAQSRRVGAPSITGNENDPEADAELATFMRGGRKRPSASGDDDLDCVQGLLSLSQGNWR